MVFRDKEFECKRFDGSTLDIEVVFTTSWADSFLVVFDWLRDTPNFSTPIYYYNSRMF